jgi:hypothetical protein
MNHVGHSRSNGCRTLAGALLLSACATVPQAPPTSVPSASESAPPSVPPTIATAPQAAANDVGTSAPETAPAALTPPPTALADRPKPRVAASASATKQLPAKRSAPVVVTAPPVPAAAAPAQTVAAPSAPAAAPAPASLDLAGLKQRLRDSSAIGVFTKLALKNQVDDLMDKFRGFYDGQLKIQLTQLRQAYDLLVLKVLALLQDSDPALAKDIVASREAIWGLLSDPVKFATL